VAGGRGLWKRFGWNRKRRNNTRLMYNRHRQRERLSQCDTSAVPVAASGYYQSMGSFVAWDVQQERC